MNIYPQYLRERQHAEIILRRMIGVKTGPLPAMLRVGEAMPAPPIGRLGKLWAKGLELTDREAARGLASASVWPFSMIRGPRVSWLMILAGIPSIAMLTFSAVQLLSIPLDVICSIGAAMCLLITWFAAIHMPRAAFHALYEDALSIQEIDTLIANATGEVDRVYLNFVRAAIIATIPNETFRDIPLTVKTLGQAADALPLTDALPLDVLAVRNEATQLLRNAQEEPDSIIANSLKRRADALNRSADATGQSALIVRRTQALRAELIAQMNALREGFAGFSDGGIHHETLTRIAEDARHIAAEATAVTEAREELDGPTSTTLMNTSITPINQQAGRPQ